MKKLTIRRFTIFLSPSYERFKKNGTKLVFMPGEKDFDKYSVRFLVHLGLK